ncbi:VanZ family protein [Methylophilus aquaticus]|uniref:VanZ family protein n=1 Tax=Methylophilus aquaticus TaxID=1971610 RepID=A0ABT9JQQ1_9PROT|nr:VanZ family protein [Methylophilus aquaticus]MDP8566881.1 VanZ family protein [Methylophilus aquaticus]
MTAYNTLFKCIFLACFVLLTYLLLIEMAPAPHASLYKDKLQHIVAFGGVAFWGVWAFANYQRWVLVGLILFGGLMEVLQGLLTVTRQPSVFDWLADIVGILLAWWLAAILKRWWKTRSGRI